jgi:hypothetical protein
LSRRIRIRWSPTKQALKVGEMGNKQYKSEKVLPADPATVWALSFPFSYVQHFFIRALYSQSIQGELKTKGNQWWFIEKKTYLKEKRDQTEGSKLVESNKIYRQPQGFSESWTILNNHICSQPHGWGIVGQPAYALDRWTCAKSEFCFNLVSVSHIKESMNSYNKDARACVMNPKHSDVLLDKIHWHGKKVLSRVFKKKYAKKVHSNFCEHVYLQILHLKKLHN